MLRPPVTVIYSTQYSYITQLLCIYIMQYCICLQIYSYYNNDALWPPD